MCKYSKEMHPNSISTFEFSRKYKRVRKICAGRTWSTIGCGCSRGCVWPFPKKYNRNTSNAEFFQVSEQQRSEGYRWELVGKTEASGTPAITIQPDNGNEWILYRLEK